MTSRQEPVSPVPARDEYVAAGALPWKRARDGLAFKLLRSSIEHGTWATIFRQEAGSSVPPHTHRGRGEYFVIRGRMELSGGAENGGVTALAGDYGFEPSGVNHDSTYFPVETEYLFIHHGAIAYREADGRVVRTMDAEGIQRLWDTADLIGSGSGGRPGRARQGTEPVRAGAPDMKLIGNYLSPYTRRVAISLHVLDIPFELEQVFIFKSPEAVEALNPLVRIPTLIAGDGEPLIESYAILDSIDQSVEPERALTPLAGAPRRRVMKATAVAVGSMEKAQWSFYEGRFRPTEKVHVPWVEHNDRQALSGLEWLDRLAADAGPAGWLAGTDAMSQADISAAVACSFVRAVRPALDIDGRLPDLARFTARCEALPSFRAAPIPTDWPR